MRHWIYLTLLILTRRVLFVPSRPRGEKPVQPSDPGDTLWCQPGHPLDLFGTRFGINRDTKRTRLGHAKDTFFLTRSCFIQRHI